MRGSAPCLVCILALSICAAISHAAMIPIDLDTLVRDSPYIVRGEVTEMRSHWNAAHTLILTDVYVVLSEEMKGDLAGTTCKVIILGGSVGSQHLDVSDVPSFEVGEDVILFLAGSPDRLSLSYQFQSKYVIEAGIVQETKLPVERFLSRIQQSIQEQNR